MPLISRRTRSRHQEYAVDGAIRPDTHTAFLSKGSAGAYTLAAPTQDGLHLKLVVVSNFQHTVTTASNCFVSFDWFNQAPDTGSVLTFYATPYGSVVNLESWDGKWIMGTDAQVCSATIT